MRKNAQRLTFVIVVIAGLLLALSTTANAATTSCRGQPSSTRLPILPAPNPRRRTAAIPRL
jgi:hypothetical protein